MGKRQSDKTRKRAVETRVRVHFADSPLLRITLPFIAALLITSFFARIRDHETLARSFYFAVACLSVWLVILAWKTQNRSRRLSFEFLPRRQHYMQAFVQGFIFLYWGWYWRPVYDSAILIFAQLLFAYAFDSLLSWTRREKWVLGFGPFPIIFSTNIFLWFKDDWFYLQFVMIAVGFLAKEFIRWNREGKLTHIFNPSAFSLSLFSFAIMLTGNSDLTWGPQIARTLFMPPRIYTVLFLLGLLAMYFFSTTLIAACAATTMFGLSAIYFHYTGVYWFVDSEIPVAIFLGLHLLVTDPATSPRTLPGKAIFGMAYGTLSFLSYGWLSSLGVPTFYDKLLPIPVLNLSVRAIDRLVLTKPAELLQDIPSRLRLSPRQLNVAFMSIWIAFFITMTAKGSIGDSHPGHYVPFWIKACDEGRTNGCRNLFRIENQYCQDGSGWACNALGAHLIEGKITPQNRPRGLGAFSAACRLGFAEACTNSMFSSIPVAGTELLRGEPRIQDLPVLLRVGKGALPPMSSAELASRACSQGWTTFCTFHGE